jgi:hypothetical protein
MTKYRGKVTIRKIPKAFIFGYSHALMDNCNHIISSISRLKPDDVPFPSRIIKYIQHFVVLGFLP